MSEPDWTRDFTFEDLANASEWASRLASLFPSSGIHIHSLWFADRHGRLLFRIKDPDSGDLLCAASEGKRWLEECFKSVQPAIREVARNAKPKRMKCSIGRQEYMVPIYSQDRLASVAGICFTSKSQKAEIQALEKFKRNLPSIRASFDGDILRVDTVHPSMRILQSMFSAVEPRRDEAGKLGSDKSVNMVWDVSKLVSSSQDFAVVLKAVARIVTMRLDVDMCSVYI